MQDNEPAAEIAVIGQSLSNSDSAASLTPDARTNTHRPRKPEVKSNVFTDSRHEEADDVGSAGGQNEPENEDEQMEERQDDEGGERQDLNIFEEAKQDDPVPQPSSSIFNIQTSFEETKQIGG
jgi:hypothetical protein